MLDRLDIKLLHALQEDGRLTNQELAERVGLSASQCSRRRAKLESDGVITGYRAVIEPERTGFDLTVYIDVTLNTHNPDNSRHFTSLVSRIPEVREACSLTGEMDYRLKILVRSLSELGEIINERLLPDASVQTVKSTIVIKQLKDAPGVPLELL